MVSGASNFIARRHSSARALLVLFVLLSPIAAVVAALPAQDQHS